MVTSENMTEEQRKRRDIFYDFYFPESIIFFSELLDKEKEKTKNMEFYQHYENIVKKAALLLREIGATDPLTASAAIQYLLWNGYFSKDKKLVYGESGRINNLGAIGADVIKGRSVCINNADFEATVQRNLGNEVLVIGARINLKQDFQFEYKPDIVCNVDEKGSLLEKLLNKFGELSPLRRLLNHAVTLVKTEERYIVSDSTNLAYANIDDFMRATFVGSEGVIELKPLLMLILESPSVEKFKDIVENTLANSDKAHLDTALVRKVYNNGIYLCKRNHFVLDDFYSEISTDIDTVCRTLVKSKHSGK